jgi:hypothetical protein
MMTAYGYKRRLTKEELRAIKSPEYDYKINSTIFTRRLIAENPIAFRKPKWAILFLGTAYPQRLQPFGIIFNRVKLKHLRENLCHMNRVKYELWVFIMAKKYISTY